MHPAHDGHNLHKETETMTIKSTVKTVASTTRDTFPFGLGDKGNIWLFNDESKTSGVVVGSVDGASKPKDVGYSSDSLVPGKFVDVPAGTVLTLEF